MTDEDGGSGVVSADVTTERRRVHIKGLRAGLVAFYVEGDDELVAAALALAEAAGLHVHLADGCEDDSCKCFRNGGTNEREH
jgi:hypothetical protein